MNSSHGADTLSTSAPGKALIPGEYAVLYGHPAVVLAVERTLHCRIHWQAAKHHTLLATPLLSAPQSFDFADSTQLVWQDASNEQRLPFIKPLFDTLEGWPELLTRQHNGETLRAHIELDSTAFYHQRSSKLGLGSSAALSVALFKAWYQLKYPNSELDPDRWLNNMIHLHRQLQHGHGSGVDIAASLYGGLLGFQLQRQQQRVSGARAQPLEWPQGLEIVWVWLGSPASTRHMIEDIELFRRQCPQEHRQHIEGMASISAAGLAAVQHGDATAMQQAIAAYGDAMQAFGEAAEAPIYTDDHRRLTALAKASGVAFKPSGAGGGDIALAAATNTAALAEFAGQCRAAGYDILGQV
jgi:phosphomevalonate kinase